MKTYFWYTILIVAALFLGCKKEKETDISGRMPVIKAPSPNLVSSNYNQVFWWESIDGATRYKIKIVSPSFDAVEKVWMDTTTQGFKIGKTLPPGKYQWRLQAENESQQSKTAISSLTIIPAALSTQSVVKISPANNYYQKLADFAFTCEELYGATWYVFEIDSLSGTGKALVKDSSETPSFNYTFNLDQEGEYKWRVYAKNNAGDSTKWSGYSTFGFYHNPPPSPSPSKPDAAAQVPSPVTFIWSKVNTAASYKLYVHKGSEGATPDIYPVTGTSKQVSFTEVGQTIHWQVSTIDKAGNESAKSTFRSFTIE